MVISNLGNGCFRLQSGETSLLLDPTGNRLKADVILRTATSADGVESSPDLVAFPGEYEVKGIEIEGFGAGEESTAKTLKTVYMVTFEEIRIAFLGQVSSAPAPDAMEHLGDADVLIIPVSEDHFFTAEDAAKMVKQLEPKIAIPSYAGEKDLKALRKAMGQDAPAEDRFTFKKKELAEGQTKLVILKEKE